MLCISRNLPLTDIISRHVPSRFIYLTLLMFIPSIRSFLKLREVKRDVHTWVHIVNDYQSSTNHLRMTAFSYPGN